MSYTLLDKQIIYDGQKVRLEIHHLQNDETGQRHKREVCIHPGAVAILGVFDDGQVLLIRNRRFAIGQILTEIPAGTLEKGEDPMNCAGRELLEETGYLAGRLQRLGTFFASPGILSERIYLFIATGLRMSRAAPEEGEDIQLMPVPLEEALDMIRTGRIEDAKTISALMMYDRFHRSPAGS